MKVNMSYYVGIDFGDQRIGVSISDKEKKIAFPLGIIQRENKSFGINKLKKMIKNKDVESFVVGLPVRSDGEIGVQGEKVLKYIENLKTHFPHKIVTWDERFTTIIAEKSLLEKDMKRQKRREVIDAIAAQIILQSYLDHVNQK